MKKVFLSMAAMVITICIVVTACSKSNETNAGGGNGGGGGGGTTTCDTVNMKYAANVLPIIQANCYSCHGNGVVTSGINLDGYANLKIQVDNGNLVGVITHAAGYPAMPYNLPKLSDCNINIIKAWIARGAQNN
ncbi:MAG: cytochrome c [Chitinophagaceae bacterium]